eukprot:GHVL01019904.1.p1 GENE.GHVL01019904.1~~GHVL01019904.1.p1  ORF type:complete len:547 (+),score=93.28 GHVL01019904.1:1433-3073(+)
MWSKSVCPWETSLSDCRWRSIVRPVFSNRDLMHSVSEVDQLVNAAVGADDSPMARAERASEDRSDCSSDGNEENFVNSNLVAPEEAEDITRGPLTSLNGSYITMSPRLPAEPKSISDNSTGRWRMRMGLESQGGSTADLACSSTTTDDEVVKRRVVSLDHSQSPRDHDKKGEKFPRHTVKKSVPDNPSDDQTITDETVEVIDSLFSSRAVPDDILEEAYSAAVKVVNEVLIGYKSDGGQKFYVDVMNDWATGDRVVVDQGIEQGKHENGEGYVQDQCNCHSCKLTTLLSLLNPTNSVAESNSKQVQNMTATQSPATVSVTQSDSPPSILLRDAPPGLPCTAVKTCASVPMSSGVSASLSNGAVGPVTSPQNETPNSSIKRSSGGSCMRVYRARKNGLTGTKKSVSAAMTLGSPHLVNAQNENHAEFEGDSQSSDDSFYQPVPPMRGSPVTYKHPWGSYTTRYCGTETPMRAAMSQKYRSSSVDTDRTEDRKYTSSPLIKHVKQVRKSSKKSDDAITKRAPTDCSADSNHELCSDLLDEGCSDDDQA